MKISNYERVCKNTDQRKQAWEESEQQTVLSSHPWSSVQDNEHKLFLKKRLTLLADLREWMNQ
jgi:hypothetical protein